MKGENSVPTISEKSQEMVDQQKEKLQALGNTLKEQRAILDNLQNMAQELFPQYKGIEKPSDLPPEYQKELNDTLHEIDSITHQMTKGNAPVKTHKHKNMV